MRERGRAGGREEGRRKGGRGNLRRQQCGRRGQWEDDKSQILIENVIMGLAR